VIRQNSVRRRGGDRTTTCSRPPFDPGGVIVAAYDEARIVATVESLLALEYPGTR
jgi:hypothetical protein